MKARAERVANAMLATLEAAITAETRAKRLAGHLAQMERWAGWLVSYEFLAELEDRVLAAETAACELNDAYVALAMLWLRLASALDGGVDEFSAAFRAHEAQRSQEHASGEKPSRRDTW